MTASHLQPFNQVNFNAQHAPAGAFFSFTCGHFGTPGGFGLQIGKPGDQNLYIGVKRGGRRSAAPLRCLPFFEPPKTDLAATFLVEQVGPAEQHGVPTVPTYQEPEISRMYGWATDTWVTPDFRFSLYTPFPDLPDPAVASAKDMADAVCPSITGELVADNLNGDTVKTVFFSLGLPDPGVRLLPDAAGFIHRDGYGVRAEATFEDGSPADAFTFMRWTPDGGLKDVNPYHMLGNNPGVGVEVPPGRTVSLRLALGAYLPGEVTSGLAGRYLYTRYFDSVDNVLAHAMSRFDTLRDASARCDRKLADSALSTDQQFLIAHATRSYYGSTQLLEIDDDPFWIVNEGEYCMINTLDLAVDQVFWELRRNPWVVRNLLDNFVRHYSYTDQVMRRDGRQVGLRPGGISFCHDMGLRNQFSPSGESSYEIPHQNATCFSYMTAEQLCNWVIMAASYTRHTQDRAWAERIRPVLEQCLASLQARGDANGFPAFDSARCGPGGAEITTYDSLDHSLAQTRNNVYMVVKCWAAYLGLATVFDQIDAPAAAATARAAADRIATALPRHAVDGEYPAVLEPASSGYASRILPAIEAIAYLGVWDMTDPPAGSPTGHLLDSLKTHTRQLLLAPASKNLFPDGGLRLSSTSNNSWMSKIALFQLAARQTLGLKRDSAVAAILRAADTAHAAWQTSPASAYWAMSDQMVLGQASGSRYYPRCITAALWLDE